MSKRKNGSFRFIDNSNFLLYKEKSKGNSGNQKSKSEKNGRNCKTEKKKKNNFLLKWLSSVRGTRSSFEASPSQMSPNSCEGSVDLFELPMIPEKTKNPTEGEFKPAISEYSSVGPDVKTDFYEVPDKEANETRLNEELFRTPNNSLTTSAPDLTDNLNSSEKFERLLTSALFIQKGLDERVEGAVFMKKDLSKDYTGSRATNNTNQKLVNINNVRVRYKNIRREKDEEIKTLKTTSEPIWEQRQKIIHRQRLKKNLSNFLKEFVFLDEKEAFDFSKPEANYPAEDQYKAGSGSFLRKPPREVSPKILVNVKPFKEIISQDYIKSQSLKSMKSIKRSQQEHPPSKRLLMTSEKVENPGRPLFKSSATYHQKDEENNGGVESCLVILTAVKDSLNIEFVENPSGDCYNKTSYYSSQNRCQTYPIGRNLVQPEEELESLRFLNYDEKKEEENNPEEALRALKNSKSLDKVLDTLDDGDHDLIFKKNMPQFKKKIPVLPRFDSQRPGFYSINRSLLKPEEKVWRKMIWVKNPFETERLNFKKAEKMADLSLDNSREKRVEICRLECLDLRRNLLDKPEKILENVFLIICESTVINKILATRVESKTFSFCGSLREIHDMQEKNIAAVIRIENPIKFDQTIRNNELFQVNNKSSWRLLKKPFLFSPRGARTVVTYLCVYRNALPYDLASICSGAGERNPHYLKNFKLLLDSDEKLLQFLETQQILRLRLKKQNAKETRSRKFLKCLSDEEDGSKVKAEDIPKQKPALFQILAKTSNEISRKSILILNHPSYNYIFRIFENMSHPFDLGFKSYSESDLSINGISEIESLSDSRLSGTKSGIRKSESQSKTGSANDFSVCLDGFNVLYTNDKKSFNDDEEPSISSSRINEIRGNFFKTAKKNQKNWKEKNENSNEQTEFQESSGIFQYKSNSSSAKAIIQSKSSSEERLFRRSYVSLKEMEKTFPNLVRSTEKRMHIFDAENSESESKTKNKEIESNESCQKLVTLGQEEGVEKRKIFLKKKRGMNLKREVVAAINVIKNLSSCGGEIEKGNKRVSLVIMLTKN